MHVIMFPNRIVHSLIIFRDTDIFNYYYTICNNKMGVCVYMFE